MNEKIIRQVGDCKVNITFGLSNPDLKENIFSATAGVVYFYIGVGFLDLP